MNVGTFSGMKIIEDNNMVEIVGEDWSQVRSPARARRRRKKHRQNIKPLWAPMKTVHRFGDVLRMHPEMAAELRRQVKQSIGESK